MLAIATARKSILPICRSKRARYHSASKWQRPGAGPADLPLTAHRFLLASPECL